MSEAAGPAWEDSKRFRISFALVSDAKMVELNRTYRGRSGTTDVLSFELREPSGEDGIYLLGEVVVNREQAEKQAAELGHSVDDEIAELIKHGVLHLLGKHHPGDE